MKRRVRDRHYCHGYTPVRLYGCAFNACWEDDEGRFWVDNGEYCSQVVYCPYCGTKAPVEPEIEEE